MIAAFGNVYAEAGYRMLYQVVVLGSLVRFAFVRLPRTE